MPSFHFRSRYALLTYAQCGDLDPWEVSNFLSTIPAECIIGREDHADGGIHLHAFVDFGERFFTSNPRRFDVDGRHPNIAPCGRTPAKMYDYAIKDGEVVAGGLERPGGEDVAGAGNVWDRIVDAETAPEFWELVRALAPRVLLTNFNSLRGYVEWKYKPVVAEYITPPGIVFDLSEVEELSQFVRESLSGDCVGKLSYTSCGGEPPRSLARCRQGSGHPPLLPRVRGIMFGTLIYSRQTQVTHNLWRDKTG